MQGWCRPGLAQLLDPATWNDHGLTGIHCLLKWGRKEKFVASCSLSWTLSSGSILVCWKLGWGSFCKNAWAFFWFFFFCQRKETRILMSVLDPKPIKDGSSCVNCRLLKAPKENHLPAKFLQFSFLDRLMLIRLFLMSLLLQNSTAANKDRTQSRRRARGE